MPQQKWCIVQPIDPNGDLTKRNNPNRLFQYIFAAPCDTKNGPQIAVIHADVLYNETKPLVRNVYNVRSIEVYDPTQQKGLLAHSGQPVSSRQHDLLSIKTIGEFVEFVKPLYFINDYVAGGYNNFLNDPTKMVHRSTKSTACCGARGNGQTNRDLKSPKS
ncbi:MAG: hypothetical protein K6A39_05760 [Clostridiales bacterium]|nr:hypothetical protein [Clostridiales bacterium]